MMNEMTEEQRAAAVARRLTKTQRRMVFRASQTYGLPLDRSFGNCLNSDKLNGVITVDYNFERRRIGDGTRRRRVYLTPFGYRVAEYVRGNGMLREMADEVSAD